MITPEKTTADRFAARNASRLPATRILGVPVSCVNLGGAVETIVKWCLNRDAHYVCVRDVHGIMRSRENTELMALHDKAGMVTPDGMPLVWLARRRGHTEVSRACGADLMDALCGASVSHGLRNYFYGGKPGVAELLADTLALRYPGLQVAGTSTPPFRPLAPEEDEITTAEIIQSAPHIVWVGLSTPSQEFWMRDHVGLITGAVLIGVGAAFDFHTGEVKRAPGWMQRSGLEWLHRLFSEPRRLWRRYLVLAPKFVWYAWREERDRK